MELNTSQPQHSEIIAKPARKPVVLIIVSLLVIALAVAASFILKQNDQINSVQNELSAAQNLFASVAKSSNNTEEEIDMSAQAQSERAQLAAGAYGCSIVDFGCDKTTQTVEQFQEMTMDQDGFAVVNVVNAKEQTLSVWLKSRIGGTGEWVVIYEGTSLPSMDVIGRFGIPTDFLAVE